MTFVHTCREHGWVNCPMCKVSAVKCFGTDLSKKQQNLSEIIIEIRKFIEETPNDQELGAKIRELWNTL